VADFSTAYVTLNSMPTATAASNAKVTLVPDLAGSAFKIWIRFRIWLDLKMQIWYILLVKFKKNW
jgi:hypothetical protein